MPNIHIEQDNAIEDRYGQIVKSDTLTSLLEALANNSWILRCCALEAIIGLAKHGKTKFDCWVKRLRKSTKIVAILQVASVPGWQRPMSLLVFLASFTIGASPYD